MSEPLETSRETSGVQPQADAAVDAALVSAFDKPAGLPFFDLDIALIRRGQQPAAQPLVQETVEASLLQATSQTTPSYTRERQALDALETLLAKRAGQKPAPVVPFPTPVAKPAAKAVATPQPSVRYVEPRIMPAPPQAQTTTGFVSPGFERVTVSPAKPAQSGEPQATVYIGMLQTALDVAQQTPDLLPSLKLQILHKAVAKREATLAMTAPASRPSHASPTILQAAIGDATPDDLPWGHVTYRLMVM